MTKGIPIQEIHFVFIRPPNIRQPRCDVVKANKIFYTADVLTYQPCRDYLQPVKTQSTLLEPHATNEHTWMVRLGSPWH